MSKKKLLSEHQIRRFMGLAGVGTLSNTFLGRSSIREQEDELPVEEPMASAEDELPVEEPMEMGAEEEVGGVGEGAIEDLVSAIAAAIEQQTGVEVNVEGEAGAEDELPVEEPMEMGAEEEGLPVEEPGLEEEPMMEIVDEEEIVAEVYRRVAKRLNRMLKNRR